MLCYNSRRLAISDSRRLLLRAAVMPQPPPSSPTFRLPLPLRRAHGQGFGSVQAIPRPELRRVALAALAVVLLSSLPYLIVAASTPPDLAFGSVLVNPIDGQSYFAKMRQGYDGAWLFRLPYTHRDEADAFLFTYHLGLGHIARITRLPLAAVYHAARIAGGSALLVVVYMLLSRVFDSTVDRRRAWWFAALTSGLGWMGLGGTDLTIPESNTFYSVLANAHFALAMALMAIIFVAVIKEATLAAALASIALAVVQPFAPIAVFAALGAFLLLKGMRAPKGAAARRFPTRQAGVVLAAGAIITPLMAYFYFATQRDPILLGWSAQNLTPSPSPLHYLLGYGVMGVLALPGARFAWRRGRDVDLMMVAWAVTSALLLYAPFALQRRFSLGLHIPVVLLGVMGLMYVWTPRLRERAARGLSIIVFAVSLPSTLLLLLATSTAALVQPPDARLFVTADEAASFQWLSENAPRESVVIAAPETGLFLPGWADVRVLYGHPFETLDAEKMKALVEQFFSGAADRAEVIRDYGVDFIFFGPRENRLGMAAPEWRAVFSAGEVTIYQAP